MATYEASLLTTATNVTGGTTPIANFKAGSQRAEVKEIGIVQHTAGTSPNAIAIARVNTTQGTATTSQVGLSREPAAVATTGQLEIAWSTAPSGFSNPLRRWTFGGTVGSGLIWTFDLQRMLTVTNATGLVIYSPITNAALATFHVYIAWEE